MGLSLQVTFRDGVILRAEKLEIIRIENSTLLRVVDTDDRESFVDPAKLACVVMCEEHPKKAAGKVGFAPA